MLEPDRGLIVWVEIQDPQKRNPKCRPAIILTTAKDIQAGAPIMVVGISTELTQTPRDEQVDLPWHPQGRVRTGLKRKCAAICSWIEEIRLETIKESAGVVPPRQMLNILNKIAGES